MTKAERLLEKIEEMVLDRGYQSPGPDASKHYDKTIKTIKKYGDARAEEAKTK